MVFWDMLPSLTSSIGKQTAPSPSVWGPAYLINKANSSKSPLFLVKWVFSLSELCLSCLPCVADQRGQDRFILAHSSAGCHHCESGTALPASHGFWWCCLALPSESPSSHTCLGNLIAAFPRPVFTFFIPVVPSSWFFSLSVQNYI